jgi:hypothetical protein
LEKDSSQRLGVSGCTAGDVCDQPFFKSIDFAKLERKEIAPPYKPKLVMERRISRNYQNISFIYSSFSAPPT